MASNKKCIFDPCSGKKADLKSYKKTAIGKIKIISRRKGDNIHELIDQETSIWCHKSCYSSYTSVSRHPPKKEKHHSLLHLKG